MEPPRLQMIYDDDMVDKYHVPPDIEPEDITPEKYPRYDIPVTKIDHPVPQLEPDDVTPEKYPRYDIPVTKADHPVPELEPENVIQEKYPRHKTSPWTVADLLDTVDGGRFSFITKNLSVIQCLGHFTLDELGMFSIYDIEECAMGLVKNEKVHLLLLVFVRSHLRKYLRHSKYY